MSDTRPVLAVLGGSFNPPHLGHALLPAYLLARGEAARVLVVPCADHPLGKVLAPFERRMSWARAAMQHYDARVEVSGIEAELAAASSGQPSYTLTLLEALEARFPDERIRLVVGSDITSSGETERWHRWDQICARFEPLVVARAGWSEPGEAALPEVSSTAVRATLDALRAGEIDPQQAALALAQRVPAAVVEALLSWVADEAPCVWVVGHGHVAAHVVPLLHDRGLEVEQLGARALCSDAPPSLPDEPPAGVYLLCRDAALESVAAALVGRLPAGVPVLHAAGARLASVALAPLAAAGHPVGTLHPICSMRSELPRSRLGTASFGVEGGADAAVAALVELIVGPERGGHVLDISDLDGRGRLAYHAACALVANHMAVLQQRAGAVLREQGLDRSSIDHGLGDLMLGSLENLLALGVPAGITGPLSRGDQATVRAHLDALDDVATRTLYRDLSIRLAVLLNELLV